MRVVVFMGLMLGVILAQPLVFENFYATPTPPNAANGAVFMEIKNQGKSSVKILSAASGVSKVVEIHTMSHENGMMKMHKLDDFSLAPGEQVRFETGGKHFMLIGLKQPLRINDNFTLELKLQVQGEKEVEKINILVPVRDTRMNTQGSHSMHNTSDSSMPAGTHGCGCGGHGAHH